MRPRALLLTLVFVGGFWLVTSRGNWSLQTLLQPISSGGKLWSEPVTAHGAQAFSADEQNNIDIYKSNRLATVHVTSVVYERDFFFRVYPSQGTGSGFVINEDGQIVTNFHVVKGSQNITVTLADQKIYKAKVLGIARRDDLALIKIQPDHKLPFVQLGDSDNLQVGQKVLAIGNPFGLDFTLTTGIVSSLGRSLDNDDQTTLDGLIQTDAAINPGNSGGPLLDSRGNVIGVNTAIFSPQNGSGESGSIGIGFAMPISRVKAMLEEYHSTGRISRPVLGISRVVLIQGDLAEALELPSSGGLLIEGLESNSPATAAGLKGPSRTVIAGGMYRIGIGGDLITAIDGKSVDTQDALQRAINKKRAGDDMVFTVFRGKGSQKVTVKLGSAPDVM